MHRFYRLCCKDGHEPRIVANWVTGELVRLMREAPLKVEPDALSATLAMLKSGELSHAQAKDVFTQVYLSGKTPAAVVEELGHAPAGGDELHAICESVVKDNPKVAADIRGGKGAALQVLVGHVMRITRGGANPEKAREVLLEIVERG